MPLRPDRLPSLPDFGYLGDVAIQQTEMRARVEQRKVFRLPVDVNQQGAEFF